MMVLVDTFIVVPSAETIHKKISRTVIGVERKWQGAKNETD
jgi:hypothetical protein